MTKVIYEAPKVEELGSFEEMTQGRSSGVRADAVIPVGGVATFLS